MEHPVFTTILEFFYLKNKMVQSSVLRLVLRMSLYNTPKIWKKLYKIADKDLLKYPMLYRISESLTFMHIIKK